MFGAVIPGRPNIVERAKVVALMERFRLGQLSHERSWFPGILVNTLRSPPDKKYVRLVNEPTGVLVTMRSPDFRPSFFRPLEFTAIGSGDAVISQIDTEADWIFAGDVGNPHMEVMAFSQCVSNFIHANQIPSVGGLFPCLRISKSGVAMHGLSVEMPIGGEQIRLQVRLPNRWVQVHVNSGMAIPLRFPWDLDFSAYKEDRVFDYLKRAEEDLRRPANGNDSAAS